MCSLRSLRPTSVCRFGRCSTRIALALPALPATLGPKEHRTRMARTKSNGNDPSKSLVTLRDTLLPKLLCGEIEVGKSSVAT